MLMIMLLVAGLGLAGSLSSASRLQASVAHPGYRIRPNPLKT
jgi:hypothetical protein